jgi:hypothetical protein
MGASIYCAEAEAYTQFTIFDLPKLKKQCLISLSLVYVDGKEKQSLISISQGKRGMQIDLR